MANPSLPHVTKRHDTDGQHLEVEGIIVDDKVVLKAQEATIVDAASTTVSATTLSSNTGVKRVVAVVDCSANGTGTTKAVFTLPAESLLLNLFAKVTTVFNGDTTTTCEVGITANPDRYIDTSDFEPETLNLLRSNIGGANNDIKVVEYNSAAVVVELLYTNDANATTGEITVTAHYIELADIGLDTVDTEFAAVVVDLDLHKAAINSILTALENHGILADA